MFKYIWQFAAIAHWDLNFQFFFGGGGILASKTVQIFGQVLQTELYFTFAKLSEWQLPWYL